MSKNLRFCYKVDKRAGLSEDEHGNPAEAFICMKSKNVNRYNLSKEEYETMQGALRTIAANQLECREDFFTPITINEYLDETDTEI